MVSRIVRKEEIAEEVLHDTFLKVWDRIDTYDASKGRLFTWMVRLAKNLAIDKTRSKEYRKEKKTDDIDNYVYPFINHGYTEQKTEGIGLSDVVKQLPDEQRFMIEQQYLHGYTQSEIADEFSIPLGTVKTRTRMAMKSLRNLLKLS